MEWLLRFDFCLHAWCLSILWPFQWAHYFLTWDQWILNNYAAQTRFIAWCVFLLVCFFIHGSWCFFAGDLNPLSAALQPLSFESVTCTVHYFLVLFSCLLPKNSYSLRSSGGENICRLESPCLIKILRQFWTQTTLNFVPSNVLMRAQAVERFLWTMSF